MVRKRIEELREFLTNNIIDYSENVMEEFYTIITENTDISKLLFFLDDVQSKEMIEDRISHVTKWGREYDGCFKGAKDERLMELKVLVSSIENANAKVFYYSKNDKAIYNFNRDRALLILDKAIDTLA